MRGSSDGFGPGLRGLDAIFEILLTWGRKMEGETPSGRTAAGRHSHSRSTGDGHGGLNVGGELLLVFG